MSVSMLVRDVWDVGLCASWLGIVLDPRRSKVVCLVKQVGCLNSIQNYIWYISLRALVKVIILRTTVFVQCFVSFFLIFFWGGGLTCHLDTMEYKTDWHFVMCMVCNRCAGHWYIGMFSTELPVAFTLSRHSRASPKSFVFRASPPQPLRAAYHAALHSFMLTIFKWHRAFSL